MDNYYYEKMTEDLNIKRCPMNDANGAITGRHIINLPSWFDENPEERKRLGWIKHITHNVKDIKDYNPQTQYLTKSIAQIDEYTVEDVYNIFNKSEEMLLLEEMLETVNWRSDIIFIGMEDA